MTVTVEAPEVQRYRTGVDIIDDLEELERQHGHDLWVSWTDDGLEQRWDCQGCPAWLQRRFADGAVTTGGGLHAACPVQVTARRTGV